MYDSQDEIDCFDEDVGNAQFLIERGDMGYRPGEQYPVVLGNSLSAQIWRASMGATLEDHKRHLESFSSLRGKNHGGIYRKKIRAGKKIRKMNKLESRKYAITEVSLDDPDIFPRNLKANEFKDLYGAVAWVNHRTGWVFDAHVTICWKLLGHAADPHQDSWLYDFFIRQYAEWCRDRDIDCLWIYTNEMADCVGAHTHFMTHLGSEQMAAFKKFVEMRMRKINKLPSFNLNAFDIEENKNGSLATQWIQFQYLCKGLDPNARFAYKDGSTVLASDLIRFGYESPGQVCCKKRYGISKNIREKARRSFGFESLMDKGVFDVGMLYPSKARCSERANVTEDQIFETIRLLGL